MDAAVLDYFVIELTNTLRHSSSIATARIKRKEAEMITAGLLAPLPPKKEPPNGVRDSIASNVSVSKTPSPDDDEEPVRMRLEAIGITVGGNLAERSFPSLCSLYSTLSRRFCLRLSRNRSTRFADPLDTVKFICKDVWSALWDKPVDNLRTNHRVGACCIRSSNDTETVCREFTCFKITLSNLCYVSHRRWVAWMPCAGHVW